MSDTQKAKIATELFGRGGDAVQKGNLDYAIDCFLKCTRLVPDKLVYRQALRGAERKKFGDNKKGATGAALRMKPAQLRLKAAKARKKWLEVIDAAEDALTFNPWHVPSLFEIGCACRELNLVKTGIWVLETALEVERTSAPVFRNLGELYAADEQFTKAVQAFEMVRKLDPSDTDADARARQLSAQATIQKGQYEQAETFRDSLHDTTKTEQVLQEQRGGAESFEARTRRQIAQAEAKLANSPDVPGLYLEIGDCHRTLREFDKAIEVYQRGLDKTGGRDPDLRMRLLDARIDPVRAKLDAVKDQIAGADRRAGGAAEKLQKLTGQRKALEAEIVKREVELYQFETELDPDNAEAFFELGHRLRRLGRIDDAIRALQKARSDPRHQWEALLWLGVAFWQKKNFSLADKNLGDALDAIAPNDEEAKKKVLYYRGCVAQDQGNADDAIGFFNDVAAIDYGYKDVAKRLDELNESRL